MLPIVETRTIELVIESSNNESPLKMNKTASNPALVPLQPLVFFPLLCVLEDVGGGGSRTGDNTNGINTATYAGAGAAGVVLIGAIVIIVLWRRRKSSSHDNGEYFFVLISVVTVPLHLTFDVVNVVSNHYVSQQYVIGFDIACCHGISTFVCEILIG